MLIHFFSRDASYHVVHDASLSHGARDEECNCCRLLAVAFADTGVDGTHWNPVLPNVRGSSARCHLSGSAHGQELCSTGQDCRCTNFPRAAESQDEVRAEAVEEAPEGGTPGGELVAETLAGMPAPSCAEGVCTSDVGTLFPDCSEGNRHDCYCPWSGGHVRLHYQVLLCALVASGSAQRRHSSGHRPTCTIRRTEGP